LLSKL